MRNATIMSVKNCSEIDALAIAVYLYRICLASESFGGHEECQKLYDALIKRLSLEKHAGRVLDTFLKKLIARKKLTPCAETENFYDTKRAPKIMFKEDRDVYDGCGNFTTETLFDVDLCRCIFSGEEKNFPKIIACTFFYDSDEKSGFAIPREAKISAKALKASRNYECVSFLKEKLKLSEAEAELLALSYRMSAVKEFYEVVDDFERDDSMISLMSLMSQKQKKEIKLLLREDEKLRSFGFMDDDGKIERDAITCIESEDLNLFFSDIIKKEKFDKAFDLESFSVKGEHSALVTRLLKNGKNANILLYGAAGAGKTEYAKSLAKACGLSAFMYKNELEIQDDEEKESALYRLNCLLSLKQEDSVIIVDEAETILKTISESFFGTFTLPRKGTVNRMLENSENKVIWILNYTNELDESTLRRFTYSIKFGEMSETMLRSIATAKLSKVKLPEATKSELLELCGKYHVTGSSVDNMVKTVQSLEGCSEGGSKIVRDVENVLSANSELLFGKAKMREVVNESYDLSVLNTSTPAEEILEMVQNALAYSEEHKETMSGIRMLFYGISGTGKTELARYIAEKLNKKIILKRASDILGKFVGENERHIKEAFAEAEASGAILLFDEADSFFADRNSARSSWERTMVNEFLTQMEEFSGILICTTNLRTLMDKAMQRRFHIMAEFKSLKKDGIEKLLRSFFPAYEFGEAEIARLVSFDSVTPGDFGALSGRIRFLPKSKVSSAYIVEELCKIQDEKSGEKAIGFCA